ncbi:PepSY domain-containing protein [Paracoccus yeei]|uniref:PepSY domain-containing protein n=1 Tax=Paracoccus yeei TaxID=147645 RepID=UPI0028D3BF43|nr:hypothetical protein [Paracoccus yeei]
MSIRPALLVLAVAVLLGLATAFLPRAPHAAPPGHGDEARDFVPEDLGFRVIPLQEAARIAGRRFQGRLIAARLAPARPEERARGVELVHELRLMTRSRDVLLIRLDARTGAFLEVAGSGMTEARRRRDD